MWLSLRRFGSLASSAYPVIRPLQQNLVEVLKGRGLCCCLSVKCSSV